MERFKITLTKASEYVKNALLYLNFPDDIEVVSYFDKANQVNYYATYTLFRKGEQTKYYMPISGKNFKKFLALGLENRGYIVDNINVIETKEGISFESFVNVATHGNLKRIKRRK